MAEETASPKANSGALGKVATAGAGLGVVAIIVGAIRDQPQLIGQIVGWGPGLLVFGGVLWVMQSFGPPFLDSQKLISQSNMLISQSLDRLVSTMEKGFLEQRREYDLHNQVLIRKVDEIRDLIVENQK